MSDTSPPRERLQGMGSGTGIRSVRIWDLPTRAFHWVLALSVVGMIASGLGGLMEWHFKLGYGVLALLLFRVIWGIVGGRWSRFASFLYAPSSLTAYLRGRSHPDHLVGHTPLGALSVFGLLLILAMQVATGLVADDEISSSGPLTRFVSGATVGLATGWHAGAGKWIVIGLTVLHVLAVAYYGVFRRHRLIGPMVSGDKLLAHPDIVPSRDDAASRMLALVIFAACGALAIWVASLRA